MSNRKSKRKVVQVTAAVTAALIFASCTSVKEYQKNRLNDSEMILGPRKIQKTELSFHSYREGASGVSGGKTGGGCGCN